MKIAASFLLACAAFLALAAAALAQDENGELPLLQISIAGQSCGLVPVEDDPEATPEATPEASADNIPDYPLLTLSEDCDELLARLRVPANGRLWIALSAPDEGGWQQLETLEDDEHPPQLDRRGRFVGCAHPEAGEQVCRVLWEHEDVVYLIEIPIMVGDAYIAPAPTSDPAATATTQPGQQGAAPQPPAAPPGGSPLPTATEEWTPPPPPTTEPHG